MRSVRLTMTVPDYFVQWLKEVDPSVEVPGITARKLLMALMHDDLKGRAYMDLPPEEEEAPPPKKPPTPIRTTQRGRLNFSLTKTTGTPGTATQWFVSPDKKGQLDNLLRTNVPVLNLYLGRTLMYQVEYSPGLLFRTDLNAIDDEPYWLIDVLSREVQAAPGFRRCF